MSTSENVAANPEQMQQETGMTVAGADQSKAVAALETMMGGLLTGAIHNFQGTPLEQWKQTAVARGGNLLSADDILGQSFNLSQFYIHPVRIAGNTPGEIIDTVRIVLFDDNGRGVAVTSEGIARSMATLLSMVGPGPWPEPIAIKVIEVKTRKGFKTLSIVPA